MPPLAIPSPYEAGRLIQCESHRWVNRGEVPHKVNFQHAGGSHNGRARTQVTLTTWAEILATLSRLSQDWTISTAMTAVSETRVISKKSMPLAEAAMKSRCLFLLTPSNEPCGVETFTRMLAGALASSDPDAGYELLSISGRWRDLPSIFRRIAQTDQVAFSLPLVAWKRMLVIPLVLLLFSFATRRRISTFLHEWAALHGLRRLALMPFVWLSQTILVVSPFIRAQIASDPWIARAADMCRLIPHPPTVRRPASLTITDRVRGVERAANECNLVIGYFGAIYDGKAPTALLEICDHLRSRGIRALIVFVGSFMQSLDDYERRFRAKIKQMALDDQVIVTGYVETSEELFALFERIGAFLFLYPEGLTARRSSVIACLQSNRPVVVSAPQSPDEFLHHRGFTTLIENGALSFVRSSAPVAEIADHLLAAAGREAGTFPAIDGDAWWAATTAATRAALARTGEILEA
jgi:glycosyltransferase involved in cell wall biosynthesis